ncbi:activating signal cointegrator 1 complex subunit 2 homolog [Nilaparvata lugens]|uniref:activating signal cointegrator 1 complex subunit 2 homolog n=1 Tax=Nilaparvata lugens TaxID=108931 RepID=UPI00193D47D2|nr:activating signal cointegrator 1 complex subunit 2 homolog [Nilaparvata lugens]
MEHKFPQLAKPQSSPLPIPHHLSQQEQRQPIPVSPPAQQLPDYDHTTVPWTLPVVPNDTGFIEYPPLPVPQHPPHPVQQQPMEHKFPQLAKPQSSPLPIPHHLSQQEQRQPMKCKFPQLAKPQSSPLPVPHHLSQQEQRQPMKSKFQEHRFPELAEPLAQHHIHPVQYPLLNAEDIRTAILQKLNAQMFELEQMEAWGAPILML